MDSTSLIQIRGMVWAYSGQGLRTTITLDGYWVNILNDFLPIKIGSFKIPPYRCNIVLCGMYVFLMKLL